MQSSADSYIINDLLIESSNHNDELFFYINKKNKLLSLNFSKNYQIRSYQYLDGLSEAKKIDYSIELI